MGKCYRYQSGGTQASTLARVTDSAREGVTRQERQANPPVAVGVIQRLVAAVGLVASAPFMVVAGIAIRLSSPGPVIFRATRVGKGGMLFTMYKLRTMHAGAAAQGTITGSADPRIFPAGRWIRRLKLDEVPQLVNVTAGQMAFVGPRPEAPEVVDNNYLPWMLETLSPFRRASSVLEASGTSSRKTSCPKILRRRSGTTSRPSCRASLPGTSCSCESEPSGMSCCWSREPLFGIIRMNWLLEASRLKEESTSQCILAEVRPSTESNDR